MHPKISGSEVFGVSRLSFWSLGIGDLPADNYALPMGPAPTRRPALGATAGDDAEARAAEQGRTGSGLGSCWPGWEQRGVAGKVEGYPREVRVGFSQVRERACRQDLALPSQVPAWRGNTCYATQQNFPPLSSALKVQLCPGPPPSPGRQRSL